MSLHNLKSEKPFIKNRQAKNFCTLSCPFLWVFLCNLVLAVSILRWVYSPVTLCYNVLWASTKRYTLSAQHLVRYSMILDRNL